MDKYTKNVIKIGRAVSEKFKYIDYIGIYVYLDIIKLVANGQTSFPRNLIKLSRVYALKLFIKM